MGSFNGLTGLHDHDHGVLSANLPSLCLPQQFPLYTVSAKFRLNTPLNGGYFADTAVVT